MTQEDKQLLIKDLCGRLPYGVKVKSKNGEVATLVNPPTAIQDDCWHFKPYLRSMSSMTEEELNEYEAENDIDVADSSLALKLNIEAKRRIYISSWYHGVDWLNAYHFDYRGLIEKGLALEAPKEMYEN